MNKKQEKVFKETRLRNLERQYKKATQKNQKEYAIELKCEIDSIKRELKGYEPQ